MDQQSLVEYSHGNVYAFDAQMMIITAIATVFFFVVLLVSLHFYSRWWLRRAAAAAAARRTHVVVLDASDGGLDPSVLSSLPVFVFSSKSPATPAPEKERALLECAVCLSEFEEEEKVRLLPRCNHAFHIECIDMWFHSHSTCPLCRSPVETAVSGPEPGSSSGCDDLCATCQDAERSENAAGDDGNNTAERRKAMDVRIDVGPAMTRLLSFKSLLSMRMKSPVGGRNGAEMNRAGGAETTELDLEDGLGEPIRV